MNYDMPKEIDEYVHRIGRTGRVGNPGRAVSYFDEKEDSHLAKSLVKLLGDAEQEVPDWLIQRASMSHETVTNFGTKSYGASDIRKRGIKTEEYPAASAFGGPYQGTSSAPDDDCWD